MPLTAVNAKVARARVAPGAPVLARRGAMLAYTGRVTFRPVVGARGGAGGAGGAVGAMLGRAAAGEGTAMMIAEGEGDVLYGVQGLHVVLVDLDGREDLTVEADRLLAHDGSLTPSVVFLGSDGAGGGGVRSSLGSGLGGLARGAMTGQGLFTTRLSGAGSVALLAHGGAFPLTVREGAPVGVDPQAYVAHTGALRVEVTASLGWRDAVGRGSGEAFQLKVSGHGTVHVQASEKKV